MKFRTKNLSPFLVVISLFFFIESQANQEHQVQVHLENTQNYGYYLSVKVGQSPNYQYFTFMIDTTSHLSWIPDSNCENCLFTNKYNNHYTCDKNNETCFQDKSKDYQLFYPQWSIYGFLGSDLITFNGLPVNQTLNCSMVFAHNISADFYNIQADGILGLGLENNIVNDLLKEGLIQKKSFSIYLSNNYLGIDQDSRLIFGGYDPTLIHENEPFQFSSIVQGTNAWSVQMEEIKIGDTSLFSTSKVAVLSSYFPDIGVPLGYMNKVLDMLEKQGLHCVQKSRFSNPMCRGHVEEIGKFPNITFTGKGFHLELPGVAYATYVTAGKESDERVQEGYHIILGFREFEETAGFSEKFILGADFLRYFYTFYDMDQKRVGFVRAKDSWVKWRRSDWWAPVMIFGVIGFIIVSILVLVGIYCRKLIRIRKHNSPDYHPEIKTQMINL